MAISISLQCLGLTILAAILLQTVAVAVSFVYFNKVLNTMQESFSRSSVSCLMNSKLQSEFLDPAAEGRRSSDPCWQVTQQLHFHIEKKIADRFQGEISTAMRNKLTGVLPILGPGVRGVPLPKVAAHVTGVASSTKAPAAAAESPRSSRRYSGERISAWEGQRGLSFLQNMELKGGELLVPRGGLYYIYAQTYFRLPSAGETEGEATGDEGAELVQYIYKKMSSYTGPILLMKSSRSVCWPRGQEPGLFSLHQAGTAFLQPADRLFVTVSNASAMETDGRASYFGAFLVD